MADDNEYTDALYFLFSEDKQEAKRDDEQKPNQTKGEKPSLPSSDTSTGSCESDTTPDAPTSSDYDESTTADPLSSQTETSSSDDEESDMEVRIEYLKEKQVLLKRAAHAMAEDEAYDAAMAHLEAREYSKGKDKGKSSEDPEESPLWKEARDVQKKYGLIVDKGECQSTRTSHSGRQARYPNPKDPAINLNSVKIVASSAFCADDQQQEHGKAGYVSTVDTDDSFQLALPTSTLQKSSGQWMAHALVWCAPSEGPHTTSSSSSSSSSSFSKGDGKWRIVSNPQTLNLSLVPPRGSMSIMRNSITIEDAIAFSTEARLVCQATPPFAIVNANKAFLILGGVSTRDSVIGTPVESILHVFSPRLEIGEDEQEECDGGSPCGNSLTSRPSFLGAVLSLSSNRRSINCRISVTPVVDRTGLGGGHHRRRRLSRSKFCACMSHVLVRILPRNHNSSPLCKKKNVASQRSNNSNGPGPPPTTSSGNKSSGDSNIAFYPDSCQMTLAENRGEGAVTNLYQGNSSDHVVVGTIG